MYDVVNILESIGQEKETTNTHGKGFGEVPGILEEVKEEGLGEKFKNSGVLSNSVKVDSITIDDAAKALPGDKHDARALRTKVRRLYDIANVFSSLNLIEKIYKPASGKAAFRRIKLEQHSKHSSKGIVFSPFGPVNVLGFKDPAKKRLIEFQENLNSTYYPQYHNQALHDLFAHYMEAWKLWVGEAAGKQQMQQTF
ncbi:hypothetical protein FH972_007481 [Carpinus fangiana]|uniref:E2F/DP family winged-helix DNA-binding domain-containing protein n=1 Tax=Carpinus fangiana TaxID=176857 RepID=A0A5N6QYG3_9ROSI|nr:hypothetical protein FH972_007481 [Carpinus fangiana]